MSPPAGEKPRLLALFATLLAGACTGHISGDEAPAAPTAGPSNAPTAPVGPPAAVPPRAGACKPVTAPVRRLNHFELDSTVRDLLGDTTRISTGFPADDRVLGFDTIASGLTVYPLLAEKYLTAAEGISERATMNLTKLAGCDPAKVGEEPCARQLVEGLGKRAWRRPLLPTEITALLRSFTTGRAAGDFRLGAQYVVQRLLLSPHFLYRLELGGTADATGRVRLTPHEIAARLSYGLWGSMPDDALFAAADSGALADDAEIARQARRMLMDPRAREVVARFYDQWLRFGDLELAVKDDKLFPSWNAELRAALRLSTRKLVEEVVFGGGSLDTLLTTPAGYVNEKTAALFGTTSASAKDLVRAELDPTQRAGILTHPLVMAMTSKAASTSPVRRGLWVREHLLGMDLPPPLPDVNTTLPTVRPDATTRERFAQHAADPACAVCHALIDPIGFGFEKYDPLGQWRPMEKTRAVDATGEIAGADVAGKFDGAVELAKKLAGSAQVRAFAVTQLFRSTFGRAETADDACALAAARASFATSGHKLLDLIVAVTESETFRFRKGGVQ